MSGTTVAIETPLAPQVLRKAGVPVEDSLWFSRKSMGEQMQALQTPRGERILTHVRKFMSQLNASAVPMVA